MISTLGDKSPITNHQSPITHSEFLYNNSSFDNKNNNNYARKSLWV
ncbi:MAG: hypothetical protein ACKO9Y_07095 [Sphaerospermopsis kisseleviana]